MKIPVTTVDIQTLGGFNIAIAGKAVATDWPDEALKIFFCSLLSPLDLYFTWDRICRAVLGVPETRTSRCQLEEIFIRPLNRFLIKELGFNPIIAGQENLRIDQKRIHLDASEFHHAAIEGLNLMSLNNHATALEQFNKANSLYVGGYLPGMHGKIIENTRHELESLYQTAVKDGIRQSGKTSHPNDKITFQH
jgi:two-component SAPR family response regulator